MRLASGGTAIAIGVLALYAVSRGLVGNIASAWNALRGVGPAGAAAPGPVAAAAGSFPVVPPVTFTPHVGVAFAGGTPTFGGAA